MTVHEKEIARMSPAASVIARGALNGVSAVWHVAEEIPVAIMLNSEPLAVMMATPHQLDDFAIGFALAEGFLASATAVRGVLTLPAEGGVTVDVSVDEAAVLPRAAPLRGIEGRSGCGLCGVAEIGAVFRPLPRISKPVPLATDAVCRALRALPEHQPMNRVNRSVHAAGWCDADGAVLLSLTKGSRCVLENEIVHAFGLKDTTLANTLMNVLISSDGSDAGTSLSQDEMRTVEDSRLLGVATAVEDARH